MTTDTAHLQFARKLASNDLAVRTQTLTNLAKFFGKSVNVLGEEELFKIWMGLFYAMWMSDKPLVQRELAESISKLIHTHCNPENTILFIKTFFVTMHREFTKVDRLRHDKFLKFVRIFIHNSLKFLKDQEYSSEIIEKYIGALTSFWAKDDAQEIQLHICDVFFDELYNACGNEVPSEAIFQLAGLFADTLTHTSHDILKHRLSEALKALINGASYCSPKIAPRKRNALETDKALFPDVEFVTIDLGQLVEWFMNRASTRDQIQNREILYRLRNDALKKQKAEPGFREIPRTSIVKTVAEVEKEEFKRLMEEHKRAQDALPKDPILSKQDKKRKRKGVPSADAKVGEQAVTDITKEGDTKKKGKKGKAEAPAPTPVEEEPEPVVEEIKQNKNKKQRVEAPVAPSPVVSKKQEKNAKKQEESVEEKEESAPTPVKKQKIANGNVKETVEVKSTQKKTANGKVEEIVKTVVIEDDTSKKTEITTTTTTKSVKTTPAKKGAKKVEEEKVEEAPVVATENKKKGKGKKQVEEEQEEPEELTTKKKTTKPTPSPAPAANGKKRKAEEAQVVDEPAQNGTPKSTKKGKAAKSDMVTPQKSDETSTPPSTGKKSVRFSKDNHVKGNNLEFDKHQVVATTPVTPSSAKPKGVLNTPPSSASKVGKKK